MTASPLRLGRTPPTSALPRGSLGAGLRAVRRAACRCWRTPPRTTLPTPPAGLGAAQRLELAGQDVALIAPCLFLFALFGHNVLGRARDEALVGEASRQSRELIVEPAQLVRQAPAFLLHIDATLERHDHFAAIAEHRMRADAAPRRAVQGEAFELGEPD